MSFFKFSLLALLGFFIQSLHAAEQSSTWHEYRFRNMMEQRLDISCGAASMSALLTYYTDSPADEEDLLAALALVVDASEQDSVLEDGFTLLHLKQVVGQMGLELKAATIYNAQLVRFGSPALLQLKTTQGHHFVLWHGKVKGRHWIGDPSRGDMWLTDYELEKEWTGVASWLFKGGKPLPQASKQKLEAVYANR
ncbi:MAG: cysteine peptidase family C39 domain-containing protein [Burkholderiales bacterium]|jgi:uncharacterized protein|uniref:cysteine peptidase family C39 domain-containing protein n=1 Tax=Limnobacter sp. TaxID=2003368 RepID=UPI0039BD58C8|nr:cysteine peptidase family C39 domain-containing protein [Burkholderiales bacterium]